MSVDYSHKKPIELTNLLDTINQEDLLIFGTSVNYQFLEHFSPIIVDNSVWGDWTNILVISDSIMNILFSIDLLKEYSKENGWTYDINYDPEERCFIDQTSKITFIHYKGSSIKINLEEDFYDLIIIEKIDHKITLDVFSKLLYASKKIVVNTIDTPKSIVYTQDLYDFFYKISDKCEDTNIPDFYEYREVLGSFNDFKI